MVNTIWIAGSTQNTAELALRLQNDPRFHITQLLTPAPQPSGRKKVITPNPLHQFGIEHLIPIILVNKKIDSTTKEAIQGLNRPDLLLVVDFGYLIPQWFLDIPLISPINIHPSELPKYRGSSPGQFALLCGEHTSAITVIKMDRLLDHGPIIAQLPFEINSNWTASEYYKFAFALIGEHLSDILIDYITQPKITPQSDTSPTITARILSREDGFTEWKTLTQLMRGESVDKTQVLLTSCGQETNSHTFSNLVRGLSPWPGVWTLVPTRDGTKRLKLLRTSTENGKLHLELVQLEGQKPENFKQLAGKILM